MLSAVRKLPGILFLIIFGFTTALAQVDEVPSSEVMSAVGLSASASSERAGGVGVPGPVAVAEPPGGKYAPPIKVKLMTVEPGSIHYSLDGHEPDMGSPVYTSGFTFLKPTTLKFFVVDQAGNRGGVQTEVYGLINGVWRKYTRGVYLVPSVTDGRTFWMGAESGLAVYDIGSGDRSFVGESEGLVGTIINDLILDEKSELWVATDGGLNHLPGKGGIINYTVDEGLPAREVLGLGVDTDGSIWAGTKNGVCHIRDGKVITTLSSADGLPNDTVLSVAVDYNGNKWFGTRKGLAKLAGSQWKIFTRASGMIDDEIRSVAVDSDWNIWVGTPGGISVFNGENWRSYTRSDGLPGNAVVVIAPDPDGDVWVASRTGVARYSNGRWMKENSP